MPTLGSVYVGLFKDVCEYNLANKFLFHLQFYTRNLRFITETRVIAL